MKHLKSFEFYNFKNETPEVTKIVKENMMSMIAPSLSELSDKYAFIMQNYKNYPTLVEFKEGMGNIDDQTMEELLEVAKTVDRGFCFCVSAFGSDLTEAASLAGGKMSEEEAEEWLEWAKEDIYGAAFGYGEDKPTFEEFRSECKDICGKVGLPVSK